MLLKAAVLVVEAAVVEGVVDEAEVEGVKITTLLIPQKKMQLLLLQPRTMTLQKQISRKRKLPMFNQKHEIMVAEDVVAEDVLEVVAEVVEAEAEDTVLSQEASGRALAVGERSDEGEG